MRWWNANAFYAVNLARILDQRGYRVWVGSAARAPAHAKACQWGLPVVDLDFASGNPQVLVSSFWRLLKFIRREGVQVVNSHRPEDSTFGWLAQLLTGVKHVVTRGDQRPISKAPLGRFRYQRADTVVLTCQALLDRNPGVFEPIRHKIAVIYGGVDESRFKPAPPLRPSPTMLQVGWVGRLDPVKDPDTFLRAAARIRPQCQNIHFIMAAVPANIDRHRIMERATELEIDSGSYAAEGTP